MSNNHSEKQIVTKTLVKPARTKLQEALKVTLEKGDVDYIRIFSGGFEGETPYESVIHRPIGITDLDDEKDWVWSSVQDVALLLARKKSPNAESIALDRFTFKKNAAVIAKLITVDGDGDVLYPDGTKRTDFLKPFREEAKKVAKSAKLRIKAWEEENKKTRNPNPPQKVNENAHVLRALKAEVSPCSKAEIAFAEHMSSELINDCAVRACVDSYRTLKGAFAEVPQESIPWARGKVKGDVHRCIAKLIASAAEATLLGQKSNKVSDKDANTDGKSTF